MKRPLRALRREPRARAVLLCSVLSLAAPALGCRKPAPAEVVFTGLGEPGLAPPSRPPVSAVPAGAPAAPAEAPRERSPDPLAAPCAAPLGEPPAFSKRALIEAAADCAVRHYCDFDAKAVLLVSATARHERELDPASRDAARAAFAAALASWQRAELFRFGPAARSAEPGGGDLRDLIYAWPLRSECKVDEQVVSEAYLSDSFSSLDFQTSPVTGRSLSAIEYLLFGEQLGNACSAFSPINATGSWNALGAGSLPPRRAAYATAAASDVARSSARLLGAWRPEEGNFRAQLLGTAPNPAFRSEQAALNAISDALFYIDLELKDLKLARPLGLTPDCPNAVCPLDVESPHAHLSADHLRQNLLGFSRLFEGCGENQRGLGFDDWLRDTGAPDLAERMSAALATALALVNALERPLEEMLVADRQAVLAIHTAIKGVTDLLKTEFVTVLNLELPTATEGDND